MKPLAAAIRILEQARDTLTDRLVQRVLESRHDILDDAEGLTYMSEIEQVFDQIGNRLNHVNSLLANLPSAMSEDENPDSESPPHAEDVVDEETPAPLALPSPLPPSSAPRLAAPASLSGFVLQISEQDDEAAARTVAELFEIHIDRARNWTGAFRDRLTVDPQLTVRLLELPGEATTGRLNTALTLFWECFGIQGIEALGALQSLRARSSTDTVKPIRG